MQLKYSHISPGFPNTLADRVSETPESIEPAENMDQARRILLLERSIARMDRWGASGFKNFVRRDFLIPGSAANSASESDIVASDPFEDEQEFERQRILDSQEALYSSNTDSDTLESQFESQHFVRSPTRIPVSPRSHLQPGYIPSSSHGGSSEYKSPHKQHRKDEMAGLYPEGEDTQAAVDRINQARAGSRRGSSYAPPSTGALFSEHLGPSPSLGRIGEIAQRYQDEQAPPLPSAGLGITQGYSPSRRPIWAPLPTDHPEPATYRSPGRYSPRHEAQGSGFEDILPQLRPPQYNVIYSQPEPFSPERTPSSRLSRSRGSFLTAPLILETGNESLELENFTPIYSRKRYFDDDATSPTSGPKRFRYVPRLNPDVPNTPPTSSQQEIPAWESPDPPEAGPSQGLAAQTVADTAEPVVNSAANSAANSVANPAVDLAVDPAAESLTRQLNREPVHQSYYSEPRTRNDWAHRFRAHEAQLPVSPRTKPIINVDALDSPRARGSVATPELVTDSGHNVQDETRTQPSGRSHQPTLEDADSDFDQFEHRTPANTLPVTRSSTEVQENVASQESPSPENSGDGSQPSENELHSEDEPEPEGELEEPDQEPGLEEPDLESEPEALAQAQYYEDEAEDQRLQTEDDESQNDGADNGLDSLHSENTLAAELRDLQENRDAETGAAPTEFSRGWELKDWQALSNVMTEYSVAYTRGLRKVQDYVYHDLPSAVYNHFPNTQPEELRRRICVLVEWQLKNLDTA